MNHKVTLFILLTLNFDLVSAEDIKVDGSGDAFDYTSCSAFFAVMAQTMLDKPESSHRFNVMSEKMIDHAISMEDQDYSGNTADDMALKLMKEMQKSEDSAKYVIRQYLPHCRKLLKQIAVNKESKPASKPLNK